LKYSQIELAEWIEKLRNDPSVAWVLADWMEERDIRHVKQLHEAKKYLIVAHSSVSYKRKKGCGITTYFTKFKQIQVNQNGFRFEIKIQNRDKYWTNKRIQMSPTYRNLLK
jgi:hypothetical protein